jgi:FMN reductase (NADPH)
MNQILEFLTSHVSVRKFTDRDISPEEERQIVTTAQRAATSSNLQAYSVLSIRDTATKRTFAELTGQQEHVAECPLFLLFCADLHRLSRISQQKGYPFFGEYTEIFIVATVDTTLVADRALMAAQALGMGGVMVGAIRNHAEEVASICKLPELVYPVMGMSLGYPANLPKRKPRLPVRAIWFQETYSDAGMDDAVAEYDRTMAETGYLKGREVQPEKYPQFAGEYSWSEHSARRLANTSPAALRAYLREFLMNRGFLLK